MRRKWWYPTNTLPTDDATIKHNEKLGKIRSFSCSSTTIYIGRLYNKMYL